MNGVTRRGFVKNTLTGMFSGAFLSLEAASVNPQKSFFLGAQGENFWQEVRKQFPLRSNRIYLNNGTFGPAPFPVIEAVKESIDEIYFSGEYGNYQVERERLAKFFRIKTEELCLTHNTTEGINIMTWGLPLKAGDEVILTTHEHVGNGLPWINRAKLDGIVLRTFEPAETQEENIQKIKNLVGPKTRVIAIPHVTCTTGLVFPVKEIASWAKSQGIYTAIDGAHGAGTFDLNLHELGCDFYAGCFHKWMLGPVGTGFFYVKEELLDQLQAIQVGGYSDAGWDITTDPPTLSGYAPSAHRYDYGTQSRPQYVGAAAAADFHDRIGKAKIESRLRELNGYLYDGLRGLGNQVKILTPEESASRISMLSFVSEKMTYIELAKSLSQKGFRIRQVPESGVHALRVSTHIYNNKSEIDELIKSIEETLG
ncbi:aminotransferase class V-fold PLP-dependent enzyme [Algoriphagus namhaensis]